MQGVSLDLIALVIQTAIFFFALGVAWHKLNNKLNDVLKIVNHHKEEFKELVDSQSGEFKTLIEGNYKGTSNRLEAIIKQDEQIYVRCDALNDIMVYLKGIDTIVQRLNGHKN